MFKITTAEPETIPDFQRIKKILEEEEESIYDRIEKYSQLICKMCNIPLEKLLSRTRKREIVTARQIFIFVLFTVENIRPVYLSRMVGFDHATIYHSVDTVFDLYDTDYDYRQNLNLLIGTEIINKIRKKYIFKKRS